MAKKETIDISSLSDEQKKAIQAQVKDADKTAGKAEVARAKAAIECYYQLKEEIETDLMVKLWPSGPLIKGEDTPLSQTRLAEKKNTEANVSKILKAISNLPNKKPSTDKGFVAAARNVEVGKRRRLTPEQKEKRIATAKKAQQAGARGELFEKKKSDRKTAAEQKKAAVKKPVIKKAAAGQSVRKAAKKAPDKKSG